MLAPTWALYSGRCPLPFAKNSSCSGVYESAYAGSQVVAMVGRGYLRDLYPFNVVQLGCWP